MYTWDSVQVYHFDFHQARILEGIDDAQAWKTPDHELRQYLLVARPDRNTNPHDSRNTHTGSNSSTSSTVICFKWNSEIDCPSNCRFHLPKLVTQETISSCLFSAWLQNSKANGAWFIIYHIRATALSTSIYLKNGEHLSIPHLMRPNKRWFKQGPGSIMVKRDRRDAFRHIRVSPQD